MGLFFFCKGIESKFDAIDVSVGIRLHSISTRIPNVLKYWFIRQLNLYS